MSFRPRLTSLRPLADRLLSGIAVGGTLLFIFGISAGAFWTLERIEAAVHESVRRSLTTSLATAREAARHWATRQQALAATLAAGRDVSGAAERLLTTPPGGAPPLGAAKTLQHALEEALQINGLDGYWLVAQDERVVARFPADLPERIPAVASDAIVRALDGFPSLSPFPGDTSVPRLAALAPLRNSRGAPIGVLALALPATRQLARLAEQSQLRSQGRSIFFDATGRVLGLAQADRSSAAPALLADPVTGQLTEMAAAATAGRTGISLDGYRDFRGRLVVGAWTWDEQLGLGIAAEHDVAEAYHVVDTARSALLAGLAITLFLFLAVLASLMQARRGAIALSALQRRLAAVLESTTDPVCFADQHGGAIYLNDAGRALLGGRETLPQLPGAPPPPWSRLLLREEALGLAARDGTWAGETTILTTDGREVTLSQVILCHRQPDLTVDFYSTIARDITERKQLESRLANEKERAEVTLGSIGDAVVRTDAEGRIEYLNSVAEELLGASSAEVLGRTIGTIFTLIHETTREPLENPVEACLRERRGLGRTNLSLLLRRDGGELSIDDSVSPIVDRDGAIMGAVLVFHDVSRARTLSRQLAHQASHDFLTGLVNRHEFERRVGRALHRAQEDGSTHALCFLDLDQFKVVNDTCGHVAGDELLRLLAAVLQKKVRRRDTLARLGDDEFGVLLESCPPAQATRVVAELLAAVQEFRFVWEGQPFTLGVSIGVVAITPLSESLPAVLRDADAACYAAKERGRNRVHFYEPNDALMAHRQGEMQWVSRVTSALEEHRFRLYGQAIIPLSPQENQRTRCEVLLRMVERDGTIVAPGAFIPAAERYNLMGAVDRWVVQEVITMYAARQRHWRSRPIASINLSGASLGDPTMLSYLREQLARHNLPPETLCFEITETAAVANLALAAQFIRELKALGCWFALDDFGSGMSSFGYLHSLPVDELKIAGSFLRHIETDPVEYAMVEAIHRVGHVMRLKTVAEGVESLETLETLRAIGVDYAQGFAIGRPEPLDHLLNASLHSVTEAGARPYPASLRVLPRSRPASA